MRYLKLIIVFALVGLSDLNSDAVILQSKPIQQTEELKDKNGHPLGKIITKGNGTKELQDKDGHYIGKYDPKTNITSDKNGHKVGTGNLLTTLLK